MIRLAFLSLLANALLTLSGCTCNRVVPPGGGPRGSTQVSSWRGAAAVLQARDTAVSPCDDFYQYACGGWIKRATAEQTARPWSRGFSVVATRTNGQLLTILEGRGGIGAADADRAKLEGFYASCMDTDAIDAAGVQPVAEILAVIESVGTREQYYAATARLQATGVPALLLLSVEPDARAPRRNLAQLYQAGLGMPGRLFYEGAGQQAVRDQYVHYMVQLQQLLGLPAKAAEATAERVLAFETRLAGISVPTSEAGDSSRNYNPVRFEALGDAAPGIPWRQVFASMQVKTPQSVNLKTPGFFAHLGQLIAETDLRALKDHLRWQTINAYAPFLAAPLFDANHVFYRQRLGGDTRPADRRQFCIEQARSGLGDVLARDYVLDDYDRKNQPQVDALLSDLKDALLQVLAGADWMTAATRDRARRKADAIEWQIGAPARSVSYAALPIMTDAFFTNSIALNGFLFRLEAARADEPVSRDHWYAPAYVANAYYDPTQNNVVVPAGIIQSPFFAVDAPRGVNCAALGMILGHEMTHGFDSNGARYTAEGKLENWWDAESTAAFERRTGCMVAQYGAYDVPVGDGRPPRRLSLNGKMTLNENIADNGGLRLAWRALQSSRASGATCDGPSPVQGLTPDQLFFVAFAQQWCTVDTSATLEQSILTNVHAPARFRVNGVVSNMPEFAAAFSCPSQSPMVRAKRCAIW